MPPFKKKMAEPVSRPRQLVFPSDHVKACCSTIHLHAMDHDGSFLIKPCLCTLYKTQHSLQESWDLLVGRPILVLELTDIPSSLGLTDKEMKPSLQDFETL